MTPRRVLGTLYVSSLLLVGVVLVFSGILNLGSFRKNYVESLVGSYTVAGGEARRQIEYSLKYGKVLGNFANMESILREVPKDTQAIEAVQVVLPDGRIAYDLNGAVEDARLPDSLKGPADFRSGKTKDAFTWVQSRGKYHAFLPIRDRLGAWAGTLDLQFDSAAVDQRIAGYLRRTVSFMLAVGLGAVVCLSVLLFRIRVVDPEGRILKARFTAIMLAVLSLAQIAYGAGNVLMFRRAYTAIVQENAVLTGSIIRKTVATVVRKGIAYQDLDGIEDWLGRINQAVPELERIDIEAGGAVRYSTRAGAGAMDPAAGLRLPMAADLNGQGAALRLQVSRSYVAGKVRSLALDTVTMLITSFFFMVEMIMFLGLVMGMGLVGGERGAEGEADDLVRPLAFLLLISGYLSVSFIPVVMKELYEPLLGLAPSVIVGLPISAEMFGAFLSSLFIGHTIDRRGWRPAFLAGLAVFALGTITSGIAASAVPFIVARGIAGLGYGAAWMGLRGLVAAGAGPEQRKRGFSLLNAGIFAGQICGAVLGAMLAERLGFPGVFFLAGLLVVFTAAFALVLMRNVRPASTPSEGTALEKARIFFLDRNLIAFLLLITIPSAVCGMFLNYFLPVYAKGIGVSQGNIGRTFLAYGVCIIYAGPVLVRFLGNLRSVRLLSLASLLGVAALLVFCVRASFATAVAAVVLLGIADSIGLVSQNSYFVNLPAALAFGSGKALSIFSAIKKVGQMLGPYAFGMAAVLGTVPGVALIAGASLTATGAFWFTTQKNTGGPAPDSEEGAAS